MQIKLPIVVAAYDRPDSLSRILESISNAHYHDNSNIDLIISIDHSGSNACRNVAKVFNWQYGTKNIIIHNENLGLKKHILKCGDIALDNDGVIVLEDDCFVSKDFYNYSLQALSFFSDAPEICGISLYAYQLNEFAKMPFHPLEDGYDNYFMQVPSSWGQIWSKKQWGKFRDFYNSKPTINPEDNRLPAEVYKWPESSWKKYFYKYMVDSNLFFVYPHQSHSTNFGDMGTHYTYQTNVIQVPLTNSRNKKYSFSDFNIGYNKYDAYLEILPSSLKKFGFNFSEQLTIDTYLAKPLNIINTKYVLTTYNKKIAPFASFDNVLKPVLNNAIYNIKGKGLFIVKTKNYIEEKSFLNIELLKKQYPLQFNAGHTVGYTTGIKEITKSKTYNLGKKITTLLDFRKW